MKGLQRGTAFVPPFSPSSPKLSKPVALIFDINRTILISDKAAGKDRKDELKTIIAASCSGKMKSNNWVLESTELGKPDASKGHISYDKFTREILPFPALPNSMPNETKHKTIEAIKEQRRELKKYFFEPQSPGYKLNNHLNALLEASEHPEGFELIPSFYTTIDYLCQNEIPFSISFRTFGSDLPAIITEWNQFCTGNHPEFKHIHLPNAMLTPSNIGCFYRNGPTNQDTHLIMGDISLTTFNKGLQFYQEKNVTIYSGFQAIDDFLQASYAAGLTLGIRDYYPYWASQQENSASGKLVLLHPSQDSPQDTTTNRIQQIYFDDNLQLDGLKEDNKLIADFRDVTSGLPLHPIEDLFGAVCVCADPIEAILDRNYFISHINTMLKLG